jgi:hypothetical protein
MRVDEKVDKMVCWRVGLKAALLAGMMEVQMVAVMVDWKVGTLVG